MCMAVRPRHYAIMAGAAGAVTACTTTVDRREQGRLAALRNAPAVEGDPPAVDKEPIAEGVPVAPV